MKKSLLVVAIAMLSTVAFANDTIVLDDVGPSVEANGLIKYSGKIGQSNCTVALDSVEKSVELPKIYSNALKVAGSTAGNAKPFNLYLTNCPAVYVDSTGAKKTNVAIKFTNSTTVNEQTGALKNTASTAAAENVELQMLNDKGEVINLHTNDGNTQKGVLGLDNLHVFTFGARYVSRGLTTPGNFETSVPFTFEYK